MKRIAVAVLAVVVAMGLSAGAMAQDAPKERTRATKVVGQLTKIDVAAKSLTITTKDGDKSTDTIVTVTDATKITQQDDTRNGTPAKFEDLKVGQQVTAYCNTDKTAAGVMIMKATDAAAPGAPAK